MQPTIKTTSTDATEKLKSDLKALAKKSVYVGIPEDQTARRDANTITNAGLMYIHTHGSPLKHIPARPVIEPAIEASDNRQNITQELGEAARAVLGGKPGAAKQHLSKAGMLGRNAAIRWFTDSRNGWQPNKESTAKRKGSDQPLIDTAQLRRSITFIVED